MSIPLLKNRFHLLLYQYLILSKKSMKAQFSITFLSFILSSISFAGMDGIFHKNNLNPLSPEEAFVLMYRVKDQKMSVYFDIAPGYHLYKSKMKLDSGARFSYMPNGEKKYDSYYGNVELYSGKIRFDVDLTELNEKKFNIYYQGCQLNKICYPPQKQTLEF